MKFLNRFLFGISVRCLITIPCFAQSEATYYGGQSAWSYLASYSRTSQHILIGASQARSTTQVGLAYSHLLRGGSLIALSYDGAVEPLYFESDPTIAGTEYANAYGPPTVNPYPYPLRTIFTQPFEGYSIEGGIVYPIVPYSGPREKTYAFAATPIGGHLSAFPHSPVQPTFAINLGALIATRNIPVDYTSSFNFLAFAGPGIEVFANRKHSVRFEYLYEHMSNAGLGYINPGVDSGTFRVTLSTYR